MVDVRLTFRNALIFEDGEGLGWVGTLVALA